MKSDVCMLRVCVCVSWTCTTVVQCARSVNISRRHKTRQHDVTHWPPFPLTPRDHAPADSSLLPPSLTISSSVIEMCGQRVFNKIWQQWHTDRRHRRVAFRVRAGRPRSSEIAHHISTSHSVRDRTCKK